MHKGQSHAQRHPGTPGWNGAPDHPREAERIQAVLETGLLDRAPDALQESVVRLAAEICGTPISAVSLIDTDRQWFSAISGLACRETSREVAFCAHTILADGLHVVPDATKDPRFALNPLVTGAPNIRFYAGAQLASADHLPLGSLCVIDTVPRELSPGQLASLKTLAALVTAQLELFRRNSQARREDIARQEVLDRLTKIASRVPGVIYQFRQRPDGSSCFPYASDGIGQIYRVTPEEVRQDASRVFAILHPEDLDAVAASISASATSLTPWKHEYRVRFPDGTERWLLGDAVPEREADGGTLWHGFITDITTRKQSEAAVARLNAELASARHAAETANRAKSAFLANMSHEIRTPLGAILGFADLLRDTGNIGSDTASNLRSIDTIRSAGQHLLTVINDILDLSKIEAERMTIERIPISLPTILLEIEALMQPRATEKGISLRAALASPVPERIMSDPTRLRQILMNLVGNAVKFTDSGRVTISALVTETEYLSRLVIDVEDTGPGMTPEQTRSLFLPFEQADETVTRKYGGTGLGLTICHRLALLMGGHTTLARTEPNKGSCFRLTLPLEPVPGTQIVTRLKVAEEAGQPPAVETRLHGRILLAEDGHDNQRLISFHLRRAGATVDVAENGRIALELFDQAVAEGNPYDLVLTDMQMPEMDGYSLAQSLRARDRSLAIVALTAHAMPEDKVRCSEAGCHDYTTKPIDKAALLAACSAWIGKRRAAAGQERTA